MTAKDAYTANIELLDENCPIVSESAQFGAVLEAMRNSRSGMLRLVADDDRCKTSGAISRESLLAACSNLFPQLQESTELTVTCPAGHYSASAIAHAVEDADAHLLNLNVIHGTLPNSDTTVELRVNHSRGIMVARSLFRYGYETVAMHSSESAAADDTTAQRASALLHLLEM